LAFRPPAEKLKAHQRFNRPACIRVQGTRFMRQEIYGQRPDLIRIIG